MNVKKMLVALGLGALTGVAYHAIRKRVWPRLKEEAIFLKGALEELCEYPYGDMDIEDTPKWSADEVLGMSTETTAEHADARNDVAGSPEGKIAKAKAIHSAQIVSVPYNDGEKPTAAKTLAKFLGISEELARQMTKTGGYIKIVAEDDAKEERSEKLVANPEDTNATKAAWESDGDEFLSPPTDQ